MKITIKELKQLIKEEVEFSLKEAGKSNNDSIGWIQCSQCGWGQVVSREEVEVGDYVDRQACDECGLGPCKIDWTYPDGPGWRAEDITLQEQVNKPITYEDIAAEAGAINKEGGLARQMIAIEIEHNIENGDDDNLYPGWTKEDFQKLLAMIK